MGNSTPKVIIEQPLNGGFYEDYDIIEYKISVEDNEQGTTESGIDCNNVISEPSIGHDDHAHGEGSRQGCEGEFPTNPHGEGADDIFYVFNAQFTDDGGGPGVPLTGTDVVILQPKKKQAEHTQEFIDLRTETTGDFLGGGLNIGFVNHNSALKFGPMNFENIEFVTARFATQQNPAEIQFRLNNVTGPLVAKMQTSITGGWQSYDYFTTDLTDLGGTHDLYVVFKNAANPGGIGNVNWFEFHGQGVAKTNPDSLKGLTATYYPNVDFTGTPVVQKEPMVAWNWTNNAPISGIPGNNFSVRYTGEVKAPKAGNYRFSVETINGTATLFIDGVSVSPNQQIAFAADEKKEIKLEYAHTTGNAALYLRWTGSNPTNVIHEDYLIPDLDALTVNNETEHELEIPKNLHLKQNYPNPFNPSTQIQFSLPSSGKVSLKVYNLIGQVVQVLVDEIRNTGSYTATFDATGLSSGIYFYQLEFDGAVISNKMLLMK